MKLTWKNSNNPYMGLYPNAVMRFEKSDNDAVNKVKAFTFRVYPSENHFNHVPVAQMVLSFDEATHSTTILTDGVSQFKFNHDFSGFLTLEDSPYQPVAVPEPVFIGTPKYSEIFSFIEEVGNTIVFKQDFGVAWLLSREFQGELLGVNWEINV